MMTPPRKANPAESRYSNASWKERRQEVEIEEVTSIATPLEPIVTRPSFVGALAQSARSSSAQSVLAFVHAASATVAAIKAPASGASSTENKEKVAMVSPASPAARRLSITKPLVLPAAWCRALHLLLVASNSLCLTVNVVRLWLRVSAIHIDGFSVIFPVSVLLSSDVARVLGCFLWEFVYASFHSTSILRGVIGKWINWKSSNRVAPLNTSPTATTTVPTETLVQRFNNNAKDDDEAKPSVGLQDTPAESHKQVEESKPADIKPYSWLWAALRLRIKLVDCTARSGETAWTTGAIALLLAHWIIQVCIAATMSSSLPNTPTALHDLYLALVVLNMWALPIVKHVLGYRFILVLTEYFFHLLWITASLITTVIGNAIVPLGVFQDQCRSNFDMSTNTFAATKRLDPEWVARASLAIEWLVDASVGPALLRIVAGMVVVVTIESIYATFLDADFRASTLIQSPRRESGLRKTSLSSAIPDSVSPSSNASESILSICQKRLLLFATPYRISVAVSLVLGVIAIAGASHARSPALSASTACKLELRPWFKSTATCTMLDVACPSSALDGISPEILSAVRFLSIRGCEQLDAAALLAQMPSLSALSLENSNIPAWSPASLQLSQRSHSSLRSVTLLDSRILAPFLDATAPPALLVELLACGASDLPVSESSQLQHQQPSTSC